MVTYRRPVSGDRHSFNDSYEETEVPIFSGIYVHYNGVEETIKQVSNYISNIF